MAKKPKVGADDFRAKPAPKNDDFRRKATEEDKYRSALANQRGKAKSVYRDTQGEIDRIDLPSPSGTKMGAESLMGGARTLKSLLNLGVRKIQGKESLGSLKGRNYSARRYLEDTEGLANSLSPGKDSLTSFRTAKDVPPFKMNKGGKIDGCAVRGKTKGRNS